MTQRAIDGPYIYFVTTNVENRRWFFVSGGRARQLGQIIVQACEMKGFELLAYCILPNHTHLLVQKSSKRALERARHGDKDAAVWRGLSGPRRLDKISQAAKSTPPWRGLSSPRSYTLGNLMQSIKGNCSRQLPKGQFWQTRYIFKIVENERYLANVINYIRYNYRKMTLPERYGQPPFVFIDQSAIDRIFEL